MGHAQPSQDDLAGGHVDHHAAAGLAVAPAADHVRLAQRGDKPRPAAFHRQPVQVASVLGNDVRDEGRLPSWDEAVIATRGGQAREPGVDQPGMLRAEGHVMNIQVAQEVRNARQIKRVVPARLVFEVVVGQERGIGQLDDLIAGRQEHPLAVDGEAHRLRKIAEQEGHLPAVPADDPDLGRLVGRQHDRAPGAIEPGRERLGDVAPDRVGHGITPSRPGRTFSHADDGPWTDPPGRPNATTVSRTGERISRVFERRTPATVLTGEASRGRALTCPGGDERPTRERRAGPRRERSGRRASRPRAQPSFWPA